MIICSFTRTSKANKVFEAKKVRMKAIFVRQKMSCLCTIFAYCVRQWIELWNLNWYKIVLLKWADDDDKILLYAQLCLTYSSRHCVACLIIISPLLLTCMRQSYWLIALFSQISIILLPCNKRLQIRCAMQIKDTELSVWECSYAISIFFY